MCNYQKTLSSRRWVNYIFPEFVLEVDAHGMHKSTDYLLCKRTLLLYNFIFFIDAGTVHDQVSLILPLALCGRLQLPV